MRFRLERSIIFFAAALCFLGMDIIISSRLGLDFPLRFLAGTGSAPLGFAPLMPWVVDIKRIDEVEAARAGRLRLGHWRWCRPLACSQRTLAIALTVGGAKVGSLAPFGGGDRHYFSLFIALGNLDAASLSLFALLAG